MQGRRRIVFFMVMVGAVGLTACGGAAPGSDPTTTSSPAPTTSSSTASATTPLTAPVTSAVQDGRYLTEVTEADPALATYEQKQGDVALRALLTDGSAFCALLRRGGGIDDAMVGVAVGARGDEAQTELPESVTTFNAVEAVALLTLCPAEQALVPASDRTRIGTLGVRLARQSG